MGVHLKERSLTFRRKQRHPLDKLIKLTGKEMDETIERLVELAKQKDDIKVAFNANKELADIHMAAVAAVEKDDITRTLAEFKLNGAKQLVNEDEEDDTPLVNFGEIQEIE